MSEVTGLEQARIQLLDEKTGEVLKDVDVLTNANSVSYKLDKKITTGIGNYQEGSIIGETDVKNVLDNIFLGYKKPEFVSFSVLNNTDLNNIDIFKDNTIIVENGTKVESFTINANFKSGSRPILNCIIKYIDNNGNVTTQNSQIECSTSTSYQIQFQVDSFTKNRSIQIILDDSVNTVQSGLISFKFINPIFVGYCDKDLIGTNSYFDNLISDGTYLEKRVYEKSDQRGITINKTISLNPCILVPSNTWSTLNNITDVNGLNIFKHFTQVTNIDIAIGSTNVKYTGYISNNKYNPADKSLKGLSYNFNSPISMSGYSGSGVPLISGFDILYSVPIDNRFIVNSYKDLSNVLNPYNGLMTYVKATKTFYGYYNGAWSPTNTKIHIVTSIPESSLGGVDDVAINIAAGLIYQKNENEEWINKGSLLGPKGDKGDKGDKGNSGTIKIGTVTTGEPGSEVIVENVGTDTDAIFNFTIPKGDPAEKASSVLYGTNLDNGELINIFIKKI